MYVYKNYLNRNNNIKNIMKKTFTHSFLSLQFNCKVNLIAISSYSNSYCTARADITKQADIKVVSGRCKISVFLQCIIVIILIYCSIFNILINAFLLYSNRMNNKKIQNGIQQNHIQKFQVLVN